MRYRSQQWIWLWAMAVGLLWIGAPLHAGAPTPASSEDEDQDQDSTPSTLRPAYITPGATEDSEDSSPSSTSPYSESSSSDSSSSGSSSSDAPEVEVIQERFPNRAIKIEREVTQDPQGNYVNHGSFKMYDERGQVVAEGHFRNGERHGLWNRWYRGREAELLTKAPYNQFVGPYVSQANFEDGKLNGKWTIYDSKQHKITQWEFADGRRHGKSTWYFPTGKAMREIEYKDGEIDGQLLEWNGDGNLITKDTYQEGRKLAQKADNHAPNQKKSEGTYLFAKESLESPDDWWNMKLATYTKVGKDERHGQWTSWYATGQKQMEGEFQNDAQVGQFVWWHPNGQKALEGSFEHGKQNGKWSWWHPNGQRSVQGNYSTGNPTGRWTWWDETGKVAQSADLSRSEGVVIDTPPSKNPPALGQPIPAPGNKKIKR